MAVRAERPLELDARPPDCRDALERGVWAYMLHVERPDWERRPSTQVRLARADAERFFGRRPGR